VKYYAMDLSGIGDFIRGIGELARGIGAILRGMGGLLRVIPWIIHQLAQVPWLGVILLLLSVGGVIVVWSAYNRTRNGQDEPVHEATSGKAAKVTCNRCQHVQMVPVNLSTFTCEQCKSELERKPGTEAQT
jgi:hypothetical protein